MAEAITLTSIVVDDYDKAIDFFTRVMRFELREDSDRGGGKRWVVVAPAGGRGGGLLLAKAATADQQARVGNQTGGRVFMFLETDDFDGFHEHLRKHDVEFMEEPRHEDYGKVVVFKDAFGNKWDLIGTRQQE
ncbi:MAG: VOC family protein [Gammaproteobacteria bacterium]|nr:VOC family protein [Gammaproteobacteria bacterium]